MLSILYIWHLKCKGNGITCEVFVRQLFENKKVLERGWRSVTQRDMGRGNRPAGP